MKASLRPLSPPHKGLRNALSMISLYTGNCDPAEPHSVLRLQRCAADLQRLSQNHEANETEFVFQPLSQRVSIDLTPWRQEHEELASPLTRILTLIQTSLPSQPDQLYDLHLDFSSLHARFLKLMAWEDAVIEPLLREHFTDKELIEYQVAIMQKNTSEMLLLWFQYIVPARQLSENIPVLNSYRTGVPNESFERVILRLQQVMDPVSFKSLVEALTHSTQVARQGS